MFWKMQVDGLDIKKKKATDETTDAWRGQLTAPIMYRGEWSEDAFKKNNTLFVYLCFHSYTTVAIKTACNK